MQGQRDLAFSSILFMSCNVRDPGEGPFIWSPSMSYSGFGLSHTDLSFFSYSLNPKTKPPDFGVHRVYSVFLSSGFGTCNDRDVRIVSGCNITSCNVLVNAYATCVS